MAAFRRPFFSGPYQVLVVLLPLGSVTKADAKGVDLSDLVNDLLKREIEIIEAVR